MVVKVSAAVLKLGGGTRGYLGRFYIWRKKRYNKYWAGNSSLPV